jgi:hypothetical protein
MLNNRGISRRTFLHIMGIGMIGVSLPSPVFATISRAQDAHVFGRALHHITGQLVADSVVEIFDADAYHYQTSHGHLARASIQPMHGYTAQPRASAPLAVGSWVEVAAASTAIHSAANVRAPSHTRIGYGGIAQVNDVLADAYGNGFWYALRDAQATSMGWSQTERWRALMTPALHRTRYDLRVDRGSKTATVTNDGEVVFSTLASVGADVTRGERFLSDNCLSTYHSSHFAIPWCITWDDITTSGAYWHNDFGTTAASHNSIDLPLPVARWMYEHFSDESHLIVT